LAGCDEILAWPPDVFALCDRALEASEAYRFVVSPPPGVQLSEAGGGAEAVRLAAHWWEWLDGTGTAAPEPILAWWKTVRNAGRLGIEQVASGGEWEVIEALLALHTVADEACAGLGSATGAPPGPGCSFRAAARELFAQTGSLSRASPAVVRVLPRCRASAGGISIRSLSRHVFVSGPQVDIDWHRTPSLPTDVRPPEAHANGLLLPWPLRVRASDFRSVRYALPHMDTAETGFFTFAPVEALDLGRVDGVLRAAIDEAGTIDFVILPECAITPADINPLEALLARYGVWCLIAGVRELAADSHLGANWVHVGVRQERVWRHAAQHKHHRWRLDGRQIDQYNLGGALQPSMHWWEAVSIPRRSLQIIDMGSMTLVPLVCEDLARREPVSDLVRSIGGVASGGVAPRRPPTGIALDGPLRQRPGRRSRLRRLHPDLLWHGPSLPTTGLPTFPHRRHVEGLLRQADRDRTRRRGRRRPGCHQCHRRRFLHRGRTPPPRFNQHAHPIWRSVPTCRQTSAEHERTRVRPDIQ
jgi:hypothetical protein